MNDTAFPLLLQDIRRTFVQGDRRLDVLRGVTLELRPGEIVALVGQSGSGKSTLLHIAGLLERPDVGDVVIDGKAAGKAADRERTALRRRFLGFVYQYHHLLPEFSAVENVMLPQMLAGRSRNEARTRPSTSCRWCNWPTGWIIAPAAFQGGAAARRDCSRRRQHTARPPCRRTDRQSRFDDLGDSVSSTSGAGA